jgi:general secretion pathway protein I
VNAHTQLKLKLKLKPKPRGQRPMPKKSQGFTLIEVLVALGIVAIALMAGLRSTDALSKNASRQSTQWLAQICAENEFSRLRLSRQVPPVGESSNSCMQAGLELQVNLTVQVTPNPNFRRVDARVVQRSGLDSTPLLQLSTVMGRN